MRRFLIGTVSDEESAVHVRFTIDCLCMISIIWKGETVKLEQSSTDAVTDASTDASTLKKLEVADIGIINIYHT